MAGREQGRGRNPRAGKATERLDRGTVLGLAGMAVAIFVVANDFTAPSVALPAIERAFRVDVSTVQWTVNIYALWFGVLTVTGGRLADLLGRRRMFVVGAVTFAVFSALSAVAPSAGVLVVARALMAFGGALMWPATLGMTYALLPESRRGLAGGLVLGVVGLGNAVGPLLGGVLTDAFGWRYIFALNVPIAAIAVAAVMRSVRESHGEPGERRFDWLGMALLSGALLALLLALDEVSSLGWGDPRVIGLLVASAAMIAILVVVERRAGSWALVPSDVAANSEFRAAMLAVLMMSMTFFTALVYLPQFMEKLLGYSALRAGAGLLPLMILFACSSFMAAKLYESLGPKRVIVAGAACIPVGMLCLSLLSRASGYALLIPGMVLLGLGTGLFYSAAFTAAVSSLDQQRASLASGILYMFEVAGGAVGLGIATTIVATAAGAEARAGGHAGEAFVHGLQETLRVSAALSAIGFVIALLFVGGPPAALRIRPSLPSET
jgi:EmrB/QacA subfamily drug resistance transporter